MGGGLELSIENVLYPAKVAFPIGSCKTVKVPYCMNGRQDYLTLSSDRFFTASSTVTVSEKTIHWWLP